MTKKTKVRLAMLCGITLLTAGMHPALPALHTTEIALAHESVTTENVKINVCSSIASVRFEDTLPNNILALKESLSNGTIKVGYSTASLNVRKQPNTDSKILATVKKGTKIILLEKEKNWYKITYDNELAYVCADYVSLEDPNQKLYEFTDIDDKYVDYAIDIANYYENIDAAFIIAVIETESRGCADVVSNCGAVGLMQIIPKYFQDRMKKLNIIDAYAPYSNMLLGTDYLSELIDKYGNSYIALMCYNEGEYGGAVSRGRNGNYSNYAMTIMNRAAELREEI